MTTATTTDDHSLGVLGPLYARFDAIATGHDRLRRDVRVGMFASNRIMYFIILIAGATLHVAGLTNVQTAEQTATALRPLAGPATRPQPRRPRSTASSP